MTLDKLNRTDLIKLVAQEALAQLDDEVERMADAVNTARAAFEAEVRDRVLHENAAMIAQLAVMCNFIAGDAVVSVPRSIYAEVAQPDTVSATITNSALPFEQRMRIEVRVLVLGAVAERARDLQRALVELDDAEHRDTKVSTIKESVRKDMVAELLKGEQGAEVLAAAKQLARVVKARLVGGA